MKIIRFTKDQAISADFNPAIGNAAGIKLHSIDYNNNSYTYSFVDVDNNEIAGKVFGRTLDQEVQFVSEDLADAHILQETAEFSRTQFLANILKPTAAVTASDFIKVKEVVEAEILVAEPVAIDEATAAKSKAILDKADAQIAAADVAVESAAEVAAVDAKPVK